MMDQLYDFLDPNNSEPISTEMLKIVPNGYVADFDEYNFLGMQQPKYAMTQDQMRKIAERNVWVEAAINTVCNTFGTLGFQIVPDPRFIEQYKKDKTMRIAKVYLEELFRMQTGTFVDFSSMIKALIRDLMIMDAACIEVVRLKDNSELKKLGITQTDRKGRIVSLHPRDPAGIFIDHDEHQIHRRYVQVGINARNIMPYDDNNPVFTMDVSGAFAVFDRHDMIYIRMRPRSGSAYGTPPILSLVSSIQADLAADTNIAKFMASGGVLPGFVALDEKLDPNVVKRYSEAFKRIQRAGNREIPIISGAGNTQFVPIAANGRESEQRSLQDYYMKKILAMYGVPPHIIGLTEGVNRGLAFSQTDNYMANAINPIKSLLENIFTDRIVKEFHSGLRFEFTEGNALDWNTRYQRVAQKKQDGYIDEATAFIELGIEPPAVQTKTSLMEEINMEQAKVNLEIAKENLLNAKQQREQPQQLQQEQPKEPMEAVGQMQDQERQQNADVQKAQHVIDILSYVHPKYGKALNSTSLTSQKEDLTKPLKDQSQYSPKRKGRKQATEDFSRRNIENEKVLVNGPTNSRGGA